MLRVVTANGTVNILYVGNRSVVIISLKAKRGGGVMSVF